MKGIELRKRTAVAVAAVAVAAATTVGVIAGTGLAFDSSLGVLADGKTVNTVNFNDDPIKLRTKESVRVAVLHLASTAPAGSLIADWHTHPGPAIVAVTRGTLLLTQGSCEPTTVGSGQAYIETPNVPVLAVKGGMETLEWTVTFILPIGSPLSSPADNPCN
jgi:quercetin dioxygenase-like cupin family protein